MQLELKRYTVRETPKTFEMLDGIRYEPPKRIITIAKNPTPEDIYALMTFFAAYIEGHYKAEALLTDSAFKLRNALIRVLLMLKRGEPIPAALVDEYNLLTRGTN